MPDNISACNYNCGNCTAFKTCCDGCPGCGAALYLKKKDCKCESCIYICPQRPGAKMLFQIGLAGGALITERQISPIGSEDLPIYLPAVGDPFKKTPDAGDLPWVVVNGARFFSSTGIGLRPGAFSLDGDIRRWLNISQETKVGIHFYVQDKFLEGFWKNRAALYPYLSQFDVVFSPNFSVYEDSPRYEHLINIRRSVITYEEMLKCGIRVVPDIAWYQKTDLDLWADYVIGQSIKKVAVSTQTVGTGLHTLGSWKGYLAGIRYLAELLPSDVGIIVVGISSPGKARIAMGEIGCGGRQISFLNSQAFMMARKGRLFNYSGEKETMKGIDFDAFFLLNVSEYIKCYREIKGQVIDNA